MSELTHSCPACGQKYNQAERIAKLEATCEWREVDEFDCTTWESGCGQKWEFMCDGPVENNVKYCHGCGGLIALQEVDSD